MINPVFVYFAAEIKALQDTIINNKRVYFYEN